jgi:DNA-binding response OmpR family regulator
LAKRRSVIIVSDTPAQGERAARVLANADVTALLFSTIDQATASVTEGRPLFVLLWPNGFSSALRQPWRMLKAYAKEAGTALIAVGSPHLADAAEALASGADEYLPESLLAETLPKRVEALHQPLARRRAPFRPHTVLLADADALWRIRVGGLLEAAGYPVLYASNVLELEEALAGLRGPVPEICLLDPFEGLGGMETVRSLRAHPAGRRLALLLVSAVERDPALLHKLGELDVYDLVDKSSVGFDGVVPLLQDLVALAGQRRARRVSFLALCRFREAADVPWDAGLVYNLSASGAFVRTLSPTQEGARLQLELELDDDAPIHLSARVAWAYAFQAEVPGRPPPGMGLFFEGLSETQRAQLESRTWPTTPVPAEAPALTPGDPLPRV